MTVSLVRLDGDRTVTVSSEKFLNLSLYPGADNALDAVNFGSTLIQLDRTGMVAAPSPATAGFRPFASGTLSGAFPAGTAALAGANVSATVTVNGTALPIAAFAVPAGASLAVWASGFQTALRAQASQLPLDAQTYVSEATVEIVGENSALNPSRIVIKLGRSARPFDPASTIAFAGAGAATYRLNAAVATVSSQLFSPTAGTGVDGTLPVNVARYRGVRAAKTGLYALEDVDLFNILCAPDAAAMSGPDMRAFYSEAESYCEERRSMVLLDIPANVVRLDQMQAWLSD